MTLIAVPERATHMGDQFVWAREPRPEWVETLRAMAPCTDQQAGLVIAWEPGDPWEPIQRWFVYQVFPKHTVPADVLRQLEGPHPRSSGHGCFGTNAYGTWCLCPVPRERWVDGPAPGITRQAWELYRKYGGWARPLFVIQGTTGGHKYRYTAWESRLARAAGALPDPPPAGDLPYAEPDARTWEHLQLWSDPFLLKMYRGLVGYGLKKPGDIDSTDAKAAAFAATEILKSFGLKARAHADELAWAMRKNDAHIPRQLTDRSERLDDLDEGHHRIHEDLVDELRASA